MLEQNCQRISEFSFNGALQNSVAIFYKIKAIPPEFQAAFCHELQISLEHNNIKRAILVSHEQLPPFKTM